MPECIRCGDFTDTEPSGEYNYCLDCQDRFSEIERSGIIVEQDNEAYHIMITGDSGDSVKGGKEYTQVEALARAKHIADQTGLDALFKYEETGSRWILDEYLREHPSIRQDVHERLQRLPNEEGGLLSRVRSLLN